MSEWISVKERLPEDDRTVLISTERCNIELGRYCDGGWEWLAESFADYWKVTDSVIAWMPLPQPYKED